MNKIIKNLTESGLSLNEAKVYYAALALGPTTILKLANESGVKRATVYSVIENLIRQNLMRAEERGLKTIYAAEHPRHLESVMEQKMLRIGEIIPDLTALHKKSGKQSVVKTIQGVQASLNIYNDIRNELKSGDYIYFLGGSRGWKEIDEKEQKKHFKWKSRSNIDVRLVFQDSERAKWAEANALALKQQVKTFPEGMNLESDIMITPHKVAIMQVFPPYVSIVIEDQDIVKTYKELFEFIWGVVG